MKPQYRATSPPLPEPEKPLRITKRTNIAIRVLMFCAANRERLVTKSEIARVCKSSENHLAQVINQLGQMGIIHTHRGRNGGIELALEPEAIEIGHIFGAWSAGAAGRVFCRCG